MMRRSGRLNQLTSFVLIMCLAFSVFILSPDIAKAEDVEPTGVTLNVTTKDISPGETFQLQATVAPQGVSTTLTWTSSNTTNVTVDNNGVITGVNIGSADITVKTSNEKMASCHVNVRQKNYTQLIFEENEIKLQPGEVAKIEGEVYPADAINTEIYWESTNTEVATVEGDENKSRKAYVTGVKVGYCHVIAKNKAGEQIGLIKIKVGNPSGLEKAKIVKASKVIITELKRGKGTFKVKYKKIDEASGYQIKYKKSGQWKIIDTTKRSYTVKNLPKGKYKVKVRAYRKYNGKKYYGHYSKTQKIKVK